MCIKYVKQIESIIYLQRILPVIHRPYAELNRAQLLFFLFLHNITENRCLHGLYIPTLQMHSYTQRNIPPNIHTLLRWPASCLCAPHIILVYWEFTTSTERTRGTNYSPNETYNRCRRSVHHSISVTRIRIAAP